MFSLSLLLSLSHINAFNKTCSSHRECADEHINCGSASGSECVVNCIGSGSCEGAIIDCSANPNISTCSLNCTSALSCEEATIKCPPDGTCNINCISEDEYMCSDIKILSARNATTNINCLGDRACVAAHVECGDSRECNLDCYGPSACGEQGSPLQIYGNSTSNLTITRCIGGTQVCEDMKVHCPPNIDGQPRCFLPGNLHSVILNSFVPSKWSVIHIKMHDVIRWWCL